MAHDRRDRFDMALAALAVALALSTFVTLSGAGATIAAVVDALASVSPIAYLVIFAAGGVLFMIYGFIYLPGQESQ